MTEDTHDIYLGNDLYAWWDDGFQEDLILSERDEDGTPVHIIVLTRELQDILIKTIQKHNAERSEG